MAAGFPRFADETCRALDRLGLQSHRLLPFHLATSDGDPQADIDLAIDAAFRREAFGWIGIYNPTTGEGATSAVR